MEKKDIVVEGFCFTEEQEALQAQREAEGIVYIKARTDMDNPEMVLQIYHKITKEQLFETLVGITFLKELRDYLIMIPTIDAHQVEPIDVSVLTRNPIFEKGKDKKKSESVSKPQGIKSPLVDERQYRIEKNKEKRKMEKIRKHLQIGRMINLFLGILVVGMLIITLTGNRPNILNYETKIIDKYASWDQELTKREKAVKQKELESNITP
ncbi:MAG: hypothetical protein RR139_08470 [Lachnospiraceae bacterium]